MNDPMPDFERALPDSESQLATATEHIDYQGPLFARYLRALTLLCECAPYVDEPDFADLIDEVLEDACRYHPLEWRRDGMRWSIALRPPTRPARAAR